ncbi:MAG: integral rane sensor signal transduction histidine kinase [Candidatus Aminicenantes bacterium]|nr:integral rane sensor signal transduction histidine kinase [Candidatus Aminicenantes bacterium]
MIFRKSIKFRLTVWYLVVIAVLLVVFSTVSYRLLSNNLYRNLNKQLQARGQELQRSVRIEGDNIFFDQNVEEMVLIYEADGKLSARLGPNVQFSNIGPAVQQALFGDPSFVSAETENGPDVRLYVVPLNVNSQRRVAMAIGRVPNDILNMLGIFRIVILNSSVLLLVLAGVGGWFLAGRTLKPVERITDIARGIGESDLSRRIDVETDDELGRLASTLNGMIARLEEAFIKQRQFVADASHELRTPLAVIQAESSLVLEKPRDQEQYRRSLELVSQEVSYMSEVVSKLLLLARSDAGSEQLNIQDVDVAALLAELGQDLEALAQEKDLTLSFGPMDGLTVRGDRVRLRQLFMNILDNALRYTPGGGTIAGSVVRRDGQAVVSVTDTGIGIPEEHLPFIFDRFYRVDKARTNREGGTGLGLSIATSIARMHGGTIEVESAVGTGTTFRILLPLAGPAPAPNP